jgi:hypothetical protein
MLVVDDALLLAVLGGVAPPELDEAVRQAEVYTTGSWYYRLGRAVADRRLTGALSSALAALPPARQTLVLAGLDELPPQIGLLSLRMLVPLMRHLDTGRQLNLLTAEALTAARMLDAGIRVSTDSRLLHDACHALGVDLQVVAPS